MFPLAVLMSVTCGLERVLRLTDRHNDTAICDDEPEIYL